MKKVLFLAMFSLMCMGAMAQEAISFERIVKADGVSKDAIFSKVSEWIASNFVSTDGDYYTNREDGIITKDYYFEYKHGGFIYAAYDGIIRCKIKVAVKEGRYKVTVFNFSHTAIERRGQFEDFSMGLLTQDEKSGKKGINKSAHDKVWRDMKIYCQEMAEKNFDEIEKIKFKDNSDNW